MTNNDILRRLRYTFNFHDHKMIALFASGAVTVSKEQVVAWLKKDDDPAFVELTDSQLAAFLNGFINEKRGKKEGPQPTPEQCLTKNMVLTKLKIALNLQAEDMVAIFALANMGISKTELSAFFRKPDHKNYRQCKAQFLRNFLKGLDEKFHVARPDRFKGEQKPKADKGAKAQKSKGNKGNQAKANTDADNIEGAKPQASSIYVNPKAKASESSSSQDKPARKVLKLKPKDIWGE